MGRSPQNEKEIHYGYHRRSSLKTAQATRAASKRSRSRRKSPSNPPTRKATTHPTSGCSTIAEDFTSEIGAAWKKTSKEGADYLSVSIDDPSFPERINCRLVKTGSEQGHTLYWERPRPQSGK